MSLALALSLALAAPPASLTPLALPGGEGGIGFDDLGYARALGEVLVPAGRSGALDLVDPASRAVVQIRGFTASKAFARGHGEGTTSADAGAGLVFASDRDRRMVNVVDPARKEIVSAAKLAAGPDYVRFVAPVGEVWVTEPRAKAIEWFKLDAKAKKLERGGSFAVPDGPESLVVDAARGRAYTHSWRGATYAIDLKSHAVVATWNNGCAGSRGIALDEARGFLFAGCDEGKATALDVAHGGKILGSASSGAGVDIIAYAPKLRHLYLPGGDSKTMAVIAVGEKGELSVLGTVPTAGDAHCVAADDAGNAWVCDPKRGRLLVLHDEFSQK